RREPGPDEVHARLLAVADEEGRDIGRVAFGQDGDLDFCGFRRDHPALDRGHGGRGQLAIRDDVRSVRAGHRSSLDPVDGDVTAPDGVSVRVADPAAIDARGGVRPAATRPAASGSAACENASRDCRSHPVDKSHRSLSSLHSRPSDYTDSYRNMMRLGTLQTARLAT